MRIITPDDLGPRIFTYNELRARLWPYIGAWPWAQKELHDLWMMGAPIPNQGVPAHEFEEQRILLPSQFRRWWEEVARRHQLEMTARQALTRKGGA